MGAEVIQSALRACAPLNADVHCIALKGPGFAKSLSFSLERKKLTSYTDHGALEELVSKLNHQSGMVASSPNFQIHMADLNLRANSKIAALLCRICEEVRQSSLVARNLREDYLSKRLYELEEAMRKAGGSFDLRDLCSFIESNEDINAFPISLPPKLLRIDQIPEFEGNSGNIPISESDRGLLLECRDSGRPYYGRRRRNRRAEYFIYFPVRRGTERGGRVSSVLLVYSHSPLHFAVAYIVSELIFHYMAVRHTQGQIQTLIGTYRASDPLHSPTRLSGFKHLLEKLAGFVEPLLRQVITNTRSHSACLRLLSMQDLSLHVFKDIASALGSRSSSLPIPISKWEQSIVAFTYRMSRKVSFTHIPQTTAPELPAEYKQLGLRSVLTVRNNTRSELCFPIMCGEVCVGTLNFESPVTDGFHEDIAFLDAIRYSISSYLNRLIRANDVAWLIDRLDSHENVHELKSHVETGTISGRAAELVRSLIIDPHNRNRVAQGTVTIAKVMRDVRTWLFDAYDPLDKAILEEYLKTIKAHKISSVVLSCETADAVFVILKNLLKNLISYGDTERDNIQLVHEEDMLRIRLNTFSHIPPDEMDALTLAPILRRGTAPAYGMFLVGVLTRILDGATFVTRKEPINLNSVTIIIPSKPERIAR